jgi:hypothetical protein
MGFILAGCIYISTNLPIFALFFFYFRQYCFSTSSSSSVSWHSSQYALLSIFCRRYLRATWRICLAKSWQSWTARNPGRFTIFEVVWIIIDMTCRQFPTLPVLLIPMVSRERHHLSVPIQLNLSLMDSWAATTYSILKPYRFIMNTPMRCMLRTSTYKNQFLRTMMIIIMQWVLCRVICFCIC